MKYQVVLVPFPFDDLSSSKLRPAICLTNSKGIYNHVVCAFITSNLTAKIEPSDILLSSNDPGFTLTGLKVNSAIRLHRLTTIPERLILRILGELPLTTIDEIRSKLKTLFGIN